MKKNLIFILISLLMLAACATNTPAEPLAGSEWTLIQLNGRNPLPGTHIEINFDRTTFSGYSGCNNYGGTYQLSGDTYSVVDGIEATEAYCSPEEVMVQEGEYFDTLQNVSTYQIVGGRLEMKHADGELLLTFSQQQEAADLDPETLAGTSWQVVSMAGQAPVAGSQITLIFDGNGMVHGFAGCRIYEAEYIQTDDGIRFTSTAMAEEVCNNEDLLEQEGTFTDYFTWTERFEMVGDTLILHAQTGEQVIFEPLE